MNGKSTGVAALYARYALTCPHFWSLRFSSNIIEVKIKKNADQTGLTRHSPATLVAAACQPPILIRLSPSQSEISPQ